MDERPYKLHAPKTASEAANFAIWLSKMARSYDQQLGLALRKTTLALSSDTETWVVDLSGDQGAPYLGALKATLFEQQALRLLTRDLFDDLVGFCKTLAPLCGTTPGAVFFQVAPCFVGDLAAAAYTSGLEQPKAPRKLEDAAYEIRLMEPQFTHGVSRYYDKVALPFAKLQAESVLNKHGALSWWVSYCMVPETPVLTADLRWVPVGTLREGDRLLAFEADAPPNSPRHWQWATVLQTGKIGAPLYEVELSDGTKFRCTGEHPWLVRRRKWDANLEWYTTQQMQEALDHNGGPRRTFWFPRYFQPWQSKQDYDDGFLAAAFDGEGSVIRRGDGVRGVSFSQRPGVFLDEVKAALRRKGHRFSQYSGTNAANLHLRGGLKATLQLLGQSGSVRLLEHWLQSDPSTLQMETSGPVQLVAIREVGWGEVVTLETDTGTYIAGGFPVHNTDLWLRVFAHWSNDPTIGWAFKEGRDVLDTVARALDTSPEKAQALLFWQAHGRDISVLGRRMPEVVDLLPDTLPLWGDKLDKAFPTMVATVLQMQQAYWHTRYADTLYGRKLRPGHALGEAVAFRVFGTVEDIVAVAAVTLWQARTSGDIMVTKIDGGPAASEIRIGGVGPNTAQFAWKTVLNRLAGLSGPLSVGLQPTVVDVGGTR